MEENEVKISINKDPSFVEKWHEGEVEDFDKKKHKFWVVDPQGSDYEPEVRWFFKSVPQSVRGLYSIIIQLYKQQVK